MIQVSYNIQTYKFKYVVKIYLIQDCFRPLSKIEKNKIIYYCREM